MNETLVRLVIFFSVLAALLSFEYYFAWREKKFAWQRLGKHFLIIFAGSILVKLCIPVGLVGIAEFAQQRQWGLFNQLSFLSNFIAVIAGLLLLDCLIYWQHRFSHRWRWLWRFHRVHHTDTQLDASTALRFHPVEILLSAFYKLAIIILLGLSAETIIIFEVLLNAMAMFNHANIRMPKKVDAALRKVIVTPEMHRVHHSQFLFHRDSNYGFCLSLWDRWFFTYVYSPTKRLKLGVEGFDSPQLQNLRALLMLPFKKFD